jgi:hypothetical protein
MHMSVKQRHWLSALALVLGLGSVSTGAFALDMFTRTYLFPTPEQLTQTPTFQESVRQADPDNFAIARVNAAAGTIGVGFATSVEQTIEATARLDETWGCNCVNAPVNSPATTVRVGFDGILGPGVPGNREFTGSLDLGGTSFDFAWDGTAMTGTECSGTLHGPDCNPVVLATTTLPDGSTSVHASLQLQSILALADTFDSSLTLSAGFDPTPGPLAIDFLNTFGFNIYSSDPDVVWTSDSGRTSIAAVSPVPEPTTTLLLACSLAAMALRLRTARPARRTELAVNGN